MILRALLTLSLGAALSGCFFSLDGSLVDRRPDARPRDARVEAKGSDGAHRETSPREGSLADLPPADRFTSNADHRPQGH